MLSQNIKQRRERLCLTQQELADRLHVVRQTVSKWEKGISLPDAEMLERLADLFGVTADELLERNDASPYDHGLISDQLSQINEQLEIKNRRVRKVLIAIISVLIAIAALTVGSIILFSVTSTGSDTQTEVTEITVP